MQVTRLTHKRPHETIQHRIIPHPREPRFPAARRAGVGGLPVRAGSVFGRDFLGRDHRAHLPAAVPEWARALLDKAGLSNFALLQQKITAALGRGSQLIATQVLNIGQSTFDFVVSFFVMLYLLFFLIRDGAALSARIMRAIPLEQDIKAQLLVKFLAVARATVKGNVAVAMLQGALGGLIFWLLDVHSPVLWGTLMAFLSLLPALGAALVWIPVAIYFLMTGAIAKAVILTLAGVLVIGLVDNLLRPMLVGKDTQMPDYLVLISTLGGMALFGLNGFVIGPVVAAMFIAVWGLFTEARLEGDA